MKLPHQARLYACILALAVVCVLLAGPTVALASPLDATALLAPPAHDLMRHVADLTLMASPLVALRNQEAELVARATAKEDELKDGLPDEDVRRIEAEHASILAEIEQVRGRIAEAEEAERTAPPVGDTARRARDLRLERERSDGIVSIGRRAGLPDDAVRKAITDGTTIDAFRTLAFDHLAEQQRRVPTDPTARARITGEEDGEKRAAAIENALLHRFDPDGAPLSDQGRTYRGMTLLEMGCDLLEARGIRTRGMSRHERASAMLEMRSGGMMSTSDFPAVLANVANKTLRAGYAAAPQTFRPLVRVVPVSDFKPVSRVQLGEAPQLEKVNEHGEFKRGKMGDAAETYAVSTYGKIIAITRQVLINDDLDAFTRIPRAFGVAAANLESDLVWGQITSNPVMGDGKSLFHDDHQNKANAAAIATASVGAARKLMRNQVGLDGRTLLNVTPTYIMVPTELETLLEQFLGQIFAAKTVDVVTVSMKRLKPISEPRLDAASTSSWYLAGDPAQIDIIELAYLEGHEGLYTETRMGFDVDGVEIKVRQDVGAKVIDHRGLVKTGS